MVDNKEKIFSERIVKHMTKNETKLSAKDFSLGFLLGISLSMLTVIYKTVV